MLGALDRLTSGEYWLKTGLGSNQLNLSMAQDRAPHPSAEKPAPLTARLGPGIPARGHRPLELDAAVLLDRCLFQRLQLALQAGEFPRLLIVAVDQEQRRPEHDETDGDHPRVGAGLLILDAGDLPGTRGHPLCFC